MLSRGLSHLLEPVLKTRLDALQRGWLTLVPSRRERVLLTLRFTPSISRSVIDGNELAIPYLSLGLSFTLIAFLRHKLMIAGQSHPFIAQTISPKVSGHRRAFKQIGEDIDLLETAQELSRKLPQDRIAKVDQIAVVAQATNLIELA
jgi:hypothetical protein